MAARALGTGTISFGLVSIPVKLFTATSPQKVSFNMLHKKCGGRLVQQYWCARDEEVVERTETVKGYEYAKDQYVQFTEEELKSLESEKTSAIDIVEFVPQETVDLVYIEKSYYLGPDKGGSKPYRLLSEAMKRTGKIAVAHYWTRGKEQLVLVRPYQSGLILHQVHYANEVRSFADVDLGPEAAFKPGEAELADMLIQQLTSEGFDAGKYRDEYVERVHKAVEQKVAGQEITVAPEEPKAQIIDLFEALKASLAGVAPAAPVAAGQAAATQEEPEAKARGPKKSEPSAGESSVGTVAAAPSGRKRKTG